MPGVYLHNTSIILLASLSFFFTHENSLRQPLADVDTAYTYSAR